MPPPPKEWDEYAPVPPRSSDRQKAHSPHPPYPAQPHPARESNDPRAPAQARDAFRHLPEAARQISGQTLREEKRLEREFGRLRYQRERFFDKIARVVRDAGNLQQDQRLHPDRVARDQARLRQAWALLRQERKNVPDGFHSLEHDAARFAKKHPDLRKEAELVVTEARREGRDLPSTHSDPLPRHRVPPSHATKAMEALRQKSREADSPTCTIVTQAGRHVHIFESSGKELLALQQKYGEDLVRPERDKALHPEEWKRLRDDRRRIVRDQAAIHGQQQILARESHAIGQSARGIGKGDPSLGTHARKLSNQVQAENRDTHSFFPSVRPGDHRSGGRER